MRFSRRAAAVLAVCALLTDMGDARAELDEAEEGKSAADKQRERDAFGTLGAGLALFSVGTAIQSAWFAVADNHRDRFLGRIPLFGPIAVVANGGPTADWTTALIFSSATQALGVIAITIAIPRLLELRPKPQLPSLMPPPPPPPLCCPE